MFTHKKTQMSVYSVYRVNWVDWFYEKPNRYITIGIHDPLYVTPMMERNEKRDRYMEGVKKLEKRRRN